LRNERAAPMQSLNAEQTLNLLLHPRHTRT
jgi:hypothetical protein